MSELRGGELTQYDLNDAKVAFEFFKAFEFWFASYVFHYINL